MKDEIEEIAYWMQKRTDELRPRNLNKRVSEMTVSEKIELAKFEAVKSLKTDFLNKFIYERRSG